MLRFKTYFKRLEERVLYNPLTHADLIKYLPKGNTKRL